MNSYKNSQLVMEKLKEKIDCMDAEAVGRLKQNLKDSYMHMKDLTNRCMIDLSVAEKNDRRIFYFKPESILLKDPETQKNYRETLIKNISQTPKIIDQPSLASDLTREACDQMRDLSEPDCVREFLSDYFQRRSYILQHKKYKVLLRWAHFALTSEYLERIGHHGTFTFGRLQFELENSIKRHDRLTLDDDYGRLRDGEIKKPKAKGEKDEEGEFSNTLYTEKQKKDPLSCLRMDDFEVYLRTQTYETKLFRVAEKFIARLKYVPMSRPYEILKESRILIKQKREEAFQECRQAQQNVRSRFQASIMKKTDDLIIQMEEILERSFQCNYQLKEDFRILAPSRIQNLFELQTDILRRASQFNIHGDIEIDDGHSFTYQIHVFFTMYFQRQIIKSQFSLYDQTIRDMKDAYESNEAPDEDLGDINEVERRNLSSLLLIDYQMVDLMNSNSDQSNLFLLKKGKKILDQVHELKKNFTDMVVVRLKKAYWMDCVIMRPRIDHRVKEQAVFFNQDYMPDLLLQCIQDLIDMSDISTVNTVFSDLTQIQAQLSMNQNIMGEQSQMDNRDLFEQINNIIQTSQVQDETARQLLNHFGSILKHNIQENTFDQKQKQQPVIRGNKGKIKSSILKILPQHLIQSYYVLRHLRTKDTKTKLLYTLNFFRAVQKRISLDLREFAGREVVSQNVDNKPPYEATYIGNNAKVINNNMFFKNMNQMAQDKEQENEIRFKPDPKEEKEDKKSKFFKDLVDIKKWKYKTKFNHMMLNTCPILPPYHSKHGEPLDDKFFQPDFTDFKSTSKTHITNKSTYLLTRMDTIKLDKETKEIFIVDDYGMNLMFDCSLDDMINLDRELLKISTFYVKKTEAEFDFRHHQFPMIDRFQVIEDLYDYEFQYQYAKSELLMNYLEAYEHISDPLEQQRIMQIMTDLMAQRPRLDYTSSSTYFLESYKAEILCLQTQTKLFKEIIAYLFQNEKKHNKYIKDYLQVAFRLTNEYTNKKWTDAKQDEVLKEVKQRQMVQGGMRFQDIQVFQDQLKQQEEGSQDNNGVGASGAEEGGGSDMFAEMLGLKDMSVENVMNNAKNDEAVEDIMSQDSNFIKTQEGYPFFLKQNGNSTDSLSRIKFTEQSNEVGVLDFYESMTAIPKLCAAIDHVYQEIQKDMSSSNNLQVVAVHTIYLEKCFVEFQKSIRFTEEDQIEYPGSNFLENDMIMQSPDKLMFLIKDMVGHIEKTYKKNINPFFVSKLDLFTINNFQFPEISKSSMMDTSLGRLDVNFSRDFIETQLQSGGAQARFFPKLREDDRRINAPPMLLVFCNLVEVMRVRECLILNMTETVVLQDIYNNLKELANRANYRLIAQTPIQFQNPDGFSREHLNFFEDGALTQRDVDLAVNEYDPSLRSNLNFMNSESVQCLTLDGGLVELRAVNHYQLMQKQILLVATRSNFFMMHQHQRALAEIELFQEHRIKVAGSIIDYESLYKQTHAQGILAVCEDTVQSTRNKILVQTAQHCELNFMPVMPIKEFLRGRIEKKQREMLAVIQSVEVVKIIGHGKESIKRELLLPNTVGRLNRENRIALLHCYCTQIMKMNLVNSMKVSSMVESIRLKQFMNMFPQDFKIMRLQKSELVDYMHRNGHFQPSNHNNFDEKSIYSNLEDGEMNSFQTIPSMKTLITLEQFTFDDKHVYERSIFDQIDHLDYNLKPLQKDKFEKMQLKSRQRLLIDSLCSYLTSSVPLAFEKSVPGRTFKYYRNLSKCFEIYLFQSKLSMDRIESIQMIQCANAYERFWEDDNDPSEDYHQSVNQDKRLSELILKKMVNERRKKQYLSDELQELAKNIQQLFGNLDKTTSSLNNITIANAFLEKQLGLMQQKLVTVILTVLETFYLQKKSPEIIGVILETIQQLTKVELNVPIYFHNGFSLHQHNISVKDRYLGYYLKQDFHIFNRTVKGIKLERELLSPSILMLEEIFEQPVTFDLRSNFCGQITGSDYTAETLQSLIIGLEKTELSYLSTVLLQLESNAREYTHLMNPKLAINDGESTESLQKQCLYMAEIGTAKLLFFSMSILLAQTTLPLQWKSFQDLHGTVFQREIGWRVEEEYQRKVNMSIIKERKEREQKQNTTKAGGSQQVSEGKVIKLAREMLDEKVQNEFKVEKHKKVQRDLQMQQIRQSRILVKAAIKVSRRQIEVILIKMGYDAINNQVSSISKCLDMASQNLDQGYVENWQNFAPTLADYQPNKQRHLDPLNRIGEMQTWLTRLKNRGMDIETLTSGPGVVFSYKDLNECLQTFASQIVSHGEKEFRNRTQSLMIQINHLQHLVYIKDSRVDGLKAKVRMMHDNITRIVNSKVYEKGNGLIFELDRGLREVKFYKDHIKDFEEEMKDFVKAEFRQQLNDKDLEINLCKKQTYDMINKLILEFRELSTKEEIEKIESIRLAKEAAIGMIPGAQNRKQMQGITPSSSYNGQEGSQQLGLQVDNRNTVVELLKTQGEVIKLQNLIIKQRTLWMFKNQTQRLKFEDEIQILKNKLTSNQALWEQMADSDKRTKILQQELIFTQKSLSQCEKIIEKLKEELKLSEQERMRLFQYKQNKAQRLSELEDQVKKMDISDQVNITKVIEQIKQKDKELASLKVIQKNFNEHINLAEEVNGKREHQWQKKLNKEVEIKKQAMQRLSQVQEELKAQELGNKDISSQENSASWKNKCKELYEICRGLVEENSDLFSKVKELSLSLAQNRNDSVQTQAQTTNVHLHSEQQLMNKTRNLQDSQSIPFNQSNAFDKTPNPINSTTDQSNIFGTSSSNDHQPSSTLYSNSFLRSVKQHQLNTNEPPKSNRVVGDRGVYENHEVAQKQVLSKSAQKILGPKQSQMQSSTSIGVTQQEGRVDVSKSEYSDAYSYGGISGLNDFSLLSNFLPIRPIQVAPISIEDRNHYQRIKPTPPSKNYNISRSTSSNIDQSQPPPAKFLVQGNHNPYSLQQANKKQNSHQLRSAERIALGRQVTQGSGGGISSTIGFTKLNKATTPTKGNDKSLASTLKILQYTEENAGLQLTGNRLKQDLI